ncbi:alpha/beta hydrolase [Nocardia sp. NPDC050712]|uniref:alpha/beta fold hydrolase n=1 Tax=Nocardia sp. NPDC050712 TaxID=3155518 RepID=UPI003404C181
MKLAIEEMGSGSRTVALVHGASAAGDIWREFARVLIDNYDVRVLLVDQRGHGASARAETYAFEDFSGDLIDTLPEELDLLIGQSLGALSSMLAAVTLRPRRLILLDPPLEASLVMRLLLGYVAPVQKRLPEWVIRKLLPAGAAPDLPRRLHGIWRSWDSRMMPQLARQRGRTPHRVEPPPVPATIVLADPSSFVSAPLAGRLRAAGWDVRVKPGGVHDLHVQDPAGVVDLLADVLS